MCVQPDREGRLEGTGRGRVVGSPADGVVARNKLTGEISCEERTEYRTDTFWVPNMLFIASTRPRPDSADLVEEEGRGRRRTG